MTLLPTGLNIVRRTLAFARERGSLSVARSTVRWGTQWLLGRVGIRTTPGTFELDGRAVPYARHRYNYTWLNERAIEVALAREVLRGSEQLAVLEIGNVMAHYQPVGHLVVDKYEQARGVLNVDVTELEVHGAFDLVISISTLEHVGLDEDVFDPAKPGRAIKMLKELLNPGGRLWLTVPVGYNHALDESLRAGAFGFTDMKALRRAEARNVWRQVAVDDVWDAAYDRLLYTAHGLVVAEYVRPE
jgi:SAM-dependent methyltransferase